MDARRGLSRSATARAAMLLLAVAGQVLGQGSYFEKTQQVTVPFVSFGLHGVAADLDGNGFDDLLVRDQQGSQWYYYSNPGLLGMQNPVVYSTAGFYPPGPPFYVGIAELRIGDANGDGIPDVFVRTSTHLYEVFVFVGLGGGAFSPSYLGPLPASNVWRTLVRDLDGDGQDEVVTMSYDTALKVTEFKILTNAFPAWVETWSVSIPVSVAPGLGDFNGDGHQDLCWTSGTWPTPPVSPYSQFYAPLHTLFVKFGTPQGSFGPTQGFPVGPQVVPSAGGFFAGAGTFQIADIDDDGCDDFVTLAGLTPLQVLCILYGDPVLGFSPWTNAWSTTSPLPPSPVDSVHVGDFDADGHKDFLAGRIYVTPGVSQTDVELYRATGPRTFAASPMVYTVPPPTSWMHLAPGDYDADGDLDLIGTPEPFDFFYLRNDAIYGSGCAGSLGWPPRARVANPTLGNGGFHLGLENAAAFAPAVVALSLARHPSPAPFCPVVVDPTQLLLPTAGGIGVLTTDALGAAALPLALPTDPALAGLEFFSQWVVLDPAGGLPTPFGTMALSFGRKIILW